MAIVHDHLAFSEQRNGTIVYTQPASQTDYFQEEVVG